jgi:hypothetical protein
MKTELNTHFNNQISDADLDMVVGGNWFGDFVHTVQNFFSHPPVTIIKTLPIVPYGGSNIVASNTSR